MQLEMVFGRKVAQEVVVTGRIAVAKIDGKWYALNSRSTHPEHLHNRAERAAWAHAVGISAKEVEKYVCREKAREQREKLQEELLFAERTLTANGYTVTKNA